MSESPNQSFDSFPPNTVVELGTLTALDQFEDIFAEYIPRSWWRVSNRHSEWESRIRLSTVLRPPKFNGRISDIKLLVMPSPAEAFTEANLQGCLMNRKFQRARKNQYATADLFQDVFGFSLTADARSSGRGKIGEIQSQLYYAPSLEHDVLFGQVIFRCMAVPKLETQKFLELHETARRIGLETLRNSIMHPMSGGLPRS